MALLAMCVSGLAPTSSCPSKAFSLPGDPLRAIQTHHASACEQWASYFQEPDDDNEAGLSEEPPRYKLTQSKKDHREAVSTYRTRDHCVKRKKIYLELLAAIEDQCLSYMYPNWDEDAYHLEAQHEVQLEGRLADILRVDHLDNREAPRKQPAFVSKLSYYSQAEFVAFTVSAIGNSIPNDLHALIAEYSSGKA
jgi:hypothetical protein